MHDKLINRFRESFKVLLKLSNPNHYFSSLVCNTKMLNGRRLDITLHKSLVSSVLNIVSIL